MNMEHQVKKIFENIIETEKYEELKEYSNNSTTKKRKLNKLLTNLIETIEELLPLFSNKKVLFFLLSIIVKKVKNILNDLKEE